jgi:drug/metabolite transporter (DMT)-like permease
MQQRFLAPILLVITALLWSLGGVLIKSIDWPPMAIAAGRSIAAIPVLLVFAGPAFAGLRRGRRQRFTFSPAQVGGAIAYAATVALFVFATRMTTAANAIFLQYTAPIYVAIIGRWYLGERPLPIDWWVIAVALGGIALFFLDRLTTFGFWGNITALASALAFASLVILLRKERTGSPINIVILGNIIVGIAGAPFLLRAPLFQPRALWLVLVLGVVQLGLSYALYAEAIKHVTALEAMLIPLIEPILNPVWVMLALGERPGPWAIAGATLVLSAVLVRGIVMVRRRRNQIELRVDPPSH